MTITASDTDITYAWSGWYQGETLISTSRSYTFTMPAESVTYQARWYFISELNNYTYTATVDTSTVTKYNGSATDVVVPSVVTHIGAETFKSKRA